ncbi:MAG: hypothetical protein ABIO05_05185, partial [Ferruginibacter sp.]
VGFEKGVNVMEAFNLLPDPQTNGGLLFSVKGAGLQKVITLLKENNLDAYVQPVGKMVLQTDKIIIVKMQR